jgi:lipoate-protein ligase A
MTRRRFRLLDSGAGDGPWNMAVDEVLLRGAEERPTLRLYTWDPPALSLGYFQRIAEVPERGAVPLVRRLTGGGAILHRDEVTYAVAAPIDFFGRRARESYFRVIEFVRDALRRLGTPADFAREEGGDSFFCFERRSAFDLVAGGRKLAGSAQRRQGRRILQHGSVAAGPYPRAVRALADAFRERFLFDLEPAPLLPEEEAAARDLAAARYSAEPWTALR